MKNKFDDENDFQCCNKCDLPDTLQIVNVVLKNEEIDKKVSELNEISEQIKNSTGSLDPKLLRKADKLRTELYGQWNIVKGTYSKRVTSFTRDRR